MWQRRRLTQLNLLDQLEPETSPETGEKEIAGLVRKAMERLSAPHRDVIVHHYLKGYSYRQTADLLQLRTETVKSRLQKARKRLHKEIMAMSESGTSQTFELGPDDLAGLRHASRCRSDDPGRPVLQGVCLDAGGGIVATNGATLLNWPSKGLASLPAPVILDSLQPEMVPETDAATLVLGEETATMRTQEGRRGYSAVNSRTLRQVPECGRHSRSGPGTRAQRAPDGLLGGGRAVPEGPARTGERWMEVRAVSPKISVFFEGDLHRRVDAFPRRRWSRPRGRRWPLGLEQVSSGLLLIRCRQTAARVGPVGPPSGCRGSA